MRVDIYDVMWPSHSTHRPFFLAKSSSLNAETLMKFFILVDVYVLDCLSVFRKNSIPLCVFGDAVAMRTGEIMRSQ